MAKPNEAMLKPLQELVITTDILTEALSAHNLQKAHEAISVMLMQGISFWGQESAPMQQFFPVWDTIKTHIDRGNAEKALGQTNLWTQQLHEVISIVSQA